MSGCILQSFMEPEERTKHSGTGKLKKNDPVYVLGLPVVYEVGITLNTYYTTKGYYLNSLVNVEHDTGWTPAQSIPESYSEFCMALVYPRARLRYPGNQLCGAPQRERPPQGICVDSGSLPLRCGLARRGPMLQRCK